MELLNLFKPLNHWEEKMDILANINWEVVLQLTCVGLIVISGPIVIFVLAFRNGNL
jgi:hypothetical protein